MTTKTNQETYFIDVSLDITNLQYDETKVEYRANVKYGRGSIATYKEIKVYIL